MQLTVLCTQAFSQQSSISPCLFLKKDSEETWDTFHGRLLFALQQQTDSGVLSCLNTSAGTDAKPSSPQNAVILVK